MDTFEGRFSRSLKYSFHLCIIEALSVSGVEPSSLRSGDAADVLGSNSFELLVEAAVVSLSKVLKFIRLIAPPVVLHFSEFGLHFAANVLMCLHYARICIF